MTNGAQERSQIYKLRTAVLGRLGAWLLRAWGATWRVTTEGPDPLRPDHEAVVAAFWHRNILMAAWYYRDRDFSVAVSRSKDGDLIAAVLTALGYQRTARGSSTRGGAAALHELYGLVNSGATVSVQTDGPQGPARISKVGVVTLARLTDRPVQAVGFSARPAVRFESWDQTILPWPFARVLCRYAQPIPVTSNADEEDEERSRLELDNVLNRVTDSLDARTGLLTPEAAESHDS
jgi:lysophospholipid acyltransferase (LPLAT)-like uncharacterized protein